jgi:3',5'-cyclic AMP phosphodiesterase CpdA
MFKRGDSKMAFLIQITDTHILPPGELLYNNIDTALHLKKTVNNINRMHPMPDVVLITGDLVDRGDLVSYQHFIDLIEPLKMPAYVIPGNHDDPQTMSGAFSKTPYFPAAEDTFQYSVENLPFRILALNSHSDGTELPELDEQRLSWLKHHLKQSDKPVLIAIHHPPMTTGIELIDMGGSEWFQGLKSLLAADNQVRLIICGHCHADLCGRIGSVPVYMAPATSHQLIASRGSKVAPSTINDPAAPILHHFIDGEFLSGSNAWPADVEENRIDRKAGLSWNQLKKNMMGSRS